MIKIVSGNLLNATEDVIGHQTNCIGDTGGLAAVIFKQFPTVREDYFNMIDAQSQHGKILKGTTQLCATDDGRIIANIYGQFRSGASTDYELLSQALISCKEEMRALSLESLALPYGMGCGIGGGKWDIVYSIIEDVFTDSGIDVVLYKL